jgi:hypothetical protein
MMKGFCYCSAVVIAAGALGACVCTSMPDQHLTEGIQNLEPCATDGQYEQFVQTCLRSQCDEEPNRRPISTMSVWPAFGPESMMELWRDTESQSGGSTYGITCYYATQSLYAVFSEMKECAPDASPSAQSLPATHSLSCRIPEDLGVLLSEIWSEALYQVRYPRRRSRGLDGVMYRFGTFKEGIGHMRGEIWSPKSGTPRKLVDISDTLIQYCHTNEAARNELLGAIRSRCASVIDELRQSKGAEEPQDRDLLPEDPSHP